MSKDNILRGLKRIWKENVEPHLIMVEFDIRNRSILEREGDEEKRKIAEDFLHFIRDNVSKIKPELVMTENGTGLFLDYSTLLKEKFEILFYSFGEHSRDLGYWSNENKRIYINILDSIHFQEVIKSKSYEKLFDKYQSTIFHELIHRFDHMRYSGLHKPSDYSIYMNTYEEFNAFYQQYARSVDKIVNRMKTVEEFYSRFGVGAGSLISEFWDTMPDEMKKDIKSSKRWTNKWNKRVYQLYYEKLEQIKKNHRS